MLLERKTRTSKQGSDSFGGGEVQEAAGRGAATRGGAVLPATTRMAGQGARALKPDTGKLT